MKELHSYNTYPIYKYFNISTTMLNQAMFLLPQKGQNKNLPLINYIAPIVTLIVIHWFKTPISK